MSWYEMATVVWFVCLIIASIFAIAQIIFCWIFEVFWENVKDSKPPLTLQTNFGWSPSRTARWVVVISAVMLIASYALIVQADATKITYVISIGAALFLAIVPALITITSTLIAMVSISRIKGWESPFDLRRKLSKMQQNP